VTSLTLASDDDAAEEAAIRGVLAAFNAEAGWPMDTVPLRIVLRDADGAIQGGLLGMTTWRWLWVRNLAVAPALRGRDLGTRLLAAAEAEAARRGCVGIRLDTYSFQARGFYLKQGFCESGRIEGCPPGHTRYTMIKRLGAGEG
jgi:GNAT superfamily N-acetyltransferase